MQVIVLPSGRRVTLGTYAAAWRRLKALPPETPVEGWEWYPVPAREILWHISNGVTDRINRRGGLVIREASRERILRQLRRRVRHNCRWCGSPLGRYALEHERYCDAGCRRAYG